MTAAEADSGRLLIQVAIVFSTAQLGGAERSLTRMAIANRDPDICYSLFTIGGPGDWSRWLASQDRKGTVLNLRLLRPWCVPRLIRKIRAESPDIIYAVGLRAYFVVKALRPLLGNPRVVQAIRATYPPKSSLSRRYAIVERLFSRADAYIANSRAGADSFSKVTGVERDRIHVVPNGVDLVPLAPEFSKCGKQVLVVANLQPRKGHIQFLQVVQTVIQIHPDAKFLFAGRDDMNGAVQARARSLHLDSHVVFLGFCADLRKHFHACRLLVLPSLKYEGAPTSILEAHMHGLPVVAYSAGGGVREVINDGVDGLVVDQSDARQMTQAIVELLSNRDLAEAMGRGGREKIVREHTLEICAVRHAAIWRHIVHRRPYRN